MMADGSSPIPPAVTGDLQPAERVLRAYQITSAAETDLHDGRPASGLSILAYALATTLMMKFGPEIADTTFTDAMTSARRATAFHPHGAA